MQINLSAIREQDRVQHKIFIVYVVNLDWSFPLKRISKIQMHDGYHLIQFHIPSAFVYLLYSYISQILPLTAIRTL